MDRLGHLVRDSVRPAPVTRPQLTSTLLAGLRPRAAARDRDRREGTRAGRRRRVDRSCNELLTSPDPCCQRDSQRARRAGCLLDRRAGALRAGRVLRARDGRADTERIRALWVLRTSLGSRDSIASLVRSACEHGFNTLLVQVRAAATPISTTPSTARHRLLHQPAGFDPLEPCSPRRTRRGCASAWSTSTRVERRRSAGGARAPHLSPSRLAHGAARDRTGRGKGAGRQPRLCRQLARQTRAQTG